MKNNSFKFKQFVVHQEHCAMKVCTDACIFGASIEVNAAQNMLDIGTGTGLLSLMLAQKTMGEIDAVEIDADAYNQAKLNIEESNFATKINVYHTAIQDFEPAQKQYDLIISNPPFYQKSLQSPDNKTNKALHGITLSLEELILQVERLLLPTGSFWVLLPAYEASVLEKFANKKGLFSQKKINIRHDISKGIIRVILQLAYQQVSELIEDTLDIYELEEKRYSEKFQNLLKDYYIIF